MSETTTTETAHPRRTIRSVGAVLAGIVVGVLVTIGTDLVLHATRVFPPWGQPLVNADAFLPLAAAYRVVYGVVGSCITPRLSPDRLMQHAFVGGVIGIVVCIRRRGDHLEWRTCFRAPLASARTRRHRHAVRVAGWQTPRHAVERTSGDYKEFFLEIGRSPKR